MLAQGKRSSTSSALTTSTHRPPTSFFSNTSSSKGVPIENIGGGFKKDASGKIISAGKYTPFGHTDYQQIVADIKQFAAGGDAYCDQHPQRRHQRSVLQGIRSRWVAPLKPARSVSFSISEDEFRALPAKQLVGQLGCWTYFQSIKSDANKKFVGDFQALAQSHQSGWRKEGRPRHLFANGSLLRWSLPLESCR